MLRESPSFHFFVIPQVSVISMDKPFWDGTRKNKLLKRDFFHERKKDVPLSSLFFLDSPEEADEDAVSSFSYT